MQREYISQFHRHIVRLNCLNGWAEASRAPTMVFPAAFPMFVTHVGKNGTLSNAKALELLNASLYLLLDTTTCHFSSAAPSESGPGTQPKSEKTA